jgi:hypothetical protein
MVNFCGVIYNYSLSYVINNPAAVQSKFMLKAVTSTVY